MSFLKSMLSVLLSGLAGDYALTMLALGWLTRIVLLGSLILPIIYLIKRYEKHSLIEALDDKTFLTKETMDEVIKRIYSRKSEHDD